MTTATSLPYIQYCHSIPYNGYRTIVDEFGITVPDNTDRRTEFADYRMTLRIEQIAPKEFLVTRAICSEKDIFVKSKSRELTDLRRNIHFQCLSTGKNVEGTTQVLTIPGLHMEVVSWVHIDNSRFKKTPLGTVFNFKEPLAHPKDYIEVILKLYENKTYSERLIY